MSEKDRKDKLKELTKDLPRFNDGKLWVWTDAEIEMLRAACKTRFDEDIRSESLMFIAATGIRIYKARTDTSQGQGELIEKTMFIFNRDKKRIFDEADKYINLYHKADGDAPINQMYGEDLKSESFNMAMLIQEMQHLLERMAKALTNNDVGKGWMPIETAPKNYKTWVWIYNGEQSGIAILYESGWEWENMLKVEPAPTHWMPLPTPPTKEE